MNKQLETLKYWMDGYLHLDYDLVHGTVEQALADFIQDDKDSGGTAAYNLIKELDYLIANPVDDWDDLFYKQWFIGYYYQSEWPSALDWLRHLRDEINRLLSIK